MNKNIGKKGSIIDIIKSKMVNKGIKDLINNDLISLISNNTKGELTIQFKKTYLGGEGFHNVVIKGFKTQIQQTFEEDQKIVDNEKKRIEALNRININRSILLIKMNSLLETELKLGSKVSGVTYQISHEAFNKEGDYNVSIIITKGEKNTIAKRKIKINKINKSSSKKSKNILIGMIIAIVIIITIIAFSIIKFLEKKKIDWGKTS